MMLIISTQYKHALTNYGFSQGDIGKAMIVLQMRDQQRAV